MSKKINEVVKEAKTNPDIVRISTNPGIASEPS